MYYELLLSAVGVPDGNGLELEKIGHFFSLFEESLEYFLWCSKTISFKIKYKGTWSHI